MEALGVPALPGDHPYHLVINDRGRIFAEAVDKGLANLGVRVLRTTLRASKADSVCERPGGGVRRDCLDFLFAFHEHHLQMIHPEWTTHYNRGRPHSALSPVCLSPCRTRSRPTSTDTVCLSDTGL
jgi:hypothetical protein